MANRSSFGELRFRAIPIAVGLAILFAFANVVLLAASAALYEPPEILDFTTSTRNEILGFVSVVLIYWTHALFVVLVSRAALGVEGPVNFLADLGASLLLTVPIVFFAGLDGSGSAHSCAEGRAINRSDIPMWPWAWIGWACINFLVLPDRFMAWTSGARVAFIAPWKRLLFMTPAFALVWYFGLPFQIRVTDCTGPQEGWGLFEGGLVMFPLLGIFLFVMSVTTAILSAGFRTAKAR